MRIVLDENLPRPMIRFFDSQHQVVTVQDLGLAGTLNGELLACLEGNHDVFVTADKNLRYQQNLMGRTLAIVELPTNRLPVLKTIAASEIFTTGFVVAGTAAEKVLEKSGASKRGQDLSLKLLKFIYWAAVIFFVLSLTASEFLGRFVIGFGVFSAALTLALQGAANDFFKRLPLEIELNFTVLNACHIEQISN